ncbi:unnamed protein product [Adineta steineri]|uniref:Uncharacterized protein n=1 Tax=Adineta steineri TaxID=433720 RepID=A0A815QS68_9BILA|nr:unnamed protein product [Adineta steineri]
MYLIFSLNSILLLLKIEPTTTTSTSTTTSTTSTTTSTTTTSTTTSTKKSTTTSTTTSTTSASTSKSTSKITTAAVTAVTCNCATYGTCAGYRGSSGYPIACGNYAHDGSGYMACVYDADNGWISGTTNDCGSCCSLGSGTYGAYVGR